MPTYEYRVVPAPLRGEKARGVKSTPDRFALALANLMNHLGREGWEYQRAESLPCEERVGFTGSRTAYQHMLVFRRPLAAEAAADPPPAAVAPVLTAEPPEPIPVLPRLRAPLDLPPSAPPALGPALVLSEPQRPGGKPDLAAE